MFLDHGEVATLTQCAAPGEISVAQYIQGMNCLSGIFLFVMPELDSFHCLMKIIKQCVDATDTQKSKCYAGFRRPTGKLILLAHMQRIMCVLDRCAAAISMLVNLFVDTAQVPLPNRHGAT